MAWLFSYLFVDRQNAHRIAKVEDAFSPAARIGSDFYKVLEVETTLVYSGVGVEDIGVEFAIVADLYDFH
jgi:hypothetical protein